MAESPITAERASPLERAARAIRTTLVAKAEENGNWYNEHGEILSFEGEVPTRDIARAVLTAMREPSDAMIEAAPEIDGIKSAGEALAFWETMIDAALAEEG